MLEDLDKGDLRDMGITAIGDIKRILKFAKKENISKCKTIRGGSKLNSKIEGWLKSDNLKSEEVITLDDDDEDIKIEQVIDQDENNEKRILEQRLPRFGGVRRASVRLSLDPIHLWIFQRWCRSLF